MSSPTPHDCTAGLRTTEFETLESRLVFSADTLTGLLATGPLSAPVDDVVQWSLADAHQATGARYVMDDYGLDASGQTVAVIDSGIAWDHYALGGAYGAGNKVVGGWDFAEGDANPYDDGPAGFHGTHVAGIVASQDAQNPGVAAGADLVALRVFDDQGRGNLQWVEQALNWVHQHRNDFANPITTVNLSLGVEWNSDTVPGWANLENEFAQLEADGIFISVAAGNSFENYQSPGLGYPAASEHVVPVASHGSDGLLSDFSQRNSRVLVAPGESIRSTVPDHLLGGTSSGAWLGASGTSMATPYVAGASSVLRQAMDFMGYRNITQDSLYDHFRETADLVHDAVTGGVYHRLNLANAIDAIITDLNGSLDNPNHLGQLNQQLDLSGTIGKLTDVDAFSFTAGNSGRVTLDLSETHELTSVLRVNGQPVALTASQATFDVSAGQNYTLSVGSGNGLGHYQATLKLDRQIPAIDLGPVNGNLNHSFLVDGQAWFRVTAGRDGLLGIQLAGADGLTMQIHDAAARSISASAGSGLVHADVIAGQEYLVRVNGEQANVVMTLDNSVSLHDGVLKVRGTEQDNHLGLVESANGQWYSVTVDGVNYQLRTDTIDQISIQGVAGNNHLFIRTGAGQDQVVLSAGNVSVAGSQIQLVASGMDSVHVVGDSGDHVTMNDSVGNDMFRWGGQTARMSGSGLTSIATGFGSHSIRAGRGFDSAVLAGTAGNDFASAGGSQAWMQTDSATILAAGFADYLLHGGGGTDQLILDALVAGDHIALTGTNSVSTLAEASVTTSGFVSTIAASHSGGTGARINGTSADEFLYSDATTTALSGSDYRNVVLRFDSIIVDASSGGADSARVFDSAGNDLVTADRTRTAISGDGRARTFAGFDSLTVASQHGGVDAVEFVGTAGREVVYSSSNNVWVQSSGALFAATGFGTITVHSGGGNDAALLTGGDEDNSMSHVGGETRLTGFGFQVSTTGFQRVRLDGGGGDNSLNLGGFRDDDRLTASQAGLVAWLGETRIQASNLVWLDARAELGQSPVRELGAVDFWFALHGEWDQP